MNLYDNVRNWKHYEYVDHCKEFGKLWFEYLSMSSLKVWINSCGEETQISENVISYQIQWWSAADCLAKPYISWSSTAWWFIIYWIHYSIFLALPWSICTQNVIIISRVLVVFLQQSFYPQPFLLEGIVMPLQAVRQAINWSGDWSRFLQNTNPWKCRMDLSVQSSLEFSRPVVL